MTALVAAPARTTASTDNPVTHLYCCNPDLALCGLDISGMAEVEEDVLLCVVCEDLEDQPLACTCGAPS